MNNKCNQGCQNDWQQPRCRDGWSLDGGFVPVTSNWDFNMEDGCQRQRRHRCGACETADNGCTRRRQADYDGCNTCQKGGTRQANTCTGMADCTCERCTRRRQADCDGCTTCQKDGTRQANTCTGMADCTCERCTRRRQADGDSCGKAKTRADNRGVGIMWGKAQELDTIYDSDHALKAGTLYPELHKPLNGYWPCEENCADCAQEAAFMLWELRLYLNTHPCDKEALALFRQLCEKAEGTYATAFLPKEYARWAWTDDPWPWEFDCQCHK